jgi:hypothetical protein
MSRASILIAPIAYAVFATACVDPADSGDDAELFEDEVDDSEVESAATRACSVSKYEDPYNMLGLMQASAAVNYVRVQAGWLVKDIAWSINNRRQTASDENKVTLRFQFVQDGKWKDAARESFIRTKVGNGNGSGTVNGGLLSNGRVRVKIHFSFDSFIGPYATNACYIELN